MPIWISSHFDLCGMKPSHTFDKNSEINQLDDFYTF